MSKRSINWGLLAMILLSLAGGGALGEAAAAGKIDIPYQKFILDNGLTLIVHEDHKAPIVAFNVWYHVGSKNEKPGRTGFAHLFEHLMFNGSENYNDDYFKPMQKVGATDLNGTTNEDRTNYFENVPTPAFDLALWLESDRMGHLKGAIDQAKLDEQRGVVQNEKRQYDNEPYSIAEELIAKACFPAGHPYSWTVIGSMEDLAAAKLEDAHQWFSTYYGPNNAVIVIAGDIDAQTALAKVKQYFGDIPPCPPIARHEAWIAKRSGEQRQTVEDRVPQARITKIWNVPQILTAENDRLLLAAQLLGSGKTSRLYKRLVYDDQIATNVSVYIDNREIAGLFTIQVDVKLGVETAKVEQAIDEELRRFLASGPEPNELEKVRMQFLAGFIRGSERIGGFGGKSDILARSQVFGGRPDAYRVSLENIAATTPAALKATVCKWLADGVYTLEIRPYPEMTAGKSTVDRSKMPEPGPAPQVLFPDFQRFTLENGMKVILAERHSVPVVRLNLILDAGFATDQAGIAGTAELAMAMLDEGTARRTALQISEELALLGANLGSGSDLDTSFVILTTLKEKLDAALDIYADIILNPQFPEADFMRLQKLQIAQIQQEKSSPFTMALRVFPKLIYGEGHAYSNPFSGSGFEDSVPKLTRQHLLAFHQTWFKSDHATLVVVGDTTVAEMKPRLEKLFKNWLPGPILVKNITAVPLKTKPAVYIIDKPASPQSVVIAGQLAPSSADPERIAMETMNFILGGDFVSRLNMNIREEKHWSYGAGSFMTGARGQQPFIAYAPVQADKTKETIEEIRKELEGMLGKKPITAEEFGNAKKSQTLQLPGLWETMAAVQQSLTEMVRFGLSDDYYKQYPQRVRQLEIEDLNRAARKVIHPESVQWLVVGDRAVIEPRIRELGIADIFVIDSDGNPVK
ncbi:MAG: insulinase family protein [Acidobacteria bacterium]|nr:insulinase family protein [Acidobacteriota bacterium]MBU4307335.1 insulinase family protein [Acidobacteriota bacterium]MBU4404473.1 insulinase family protein [Acidobacteriota bacterium]MCG2810492.1 insulinase family protein [Candidatus Aminicenantes bacterium]